MGGAGKGKEGKADGQRLRVLFGALGAGQLPDDEELEAAVLARLGEGEGGQSACLFDYDALPGDDD